MEQERQRAFAERTQHETVSTRIAPPTEPARASTNHWLLRIYSTSRPNSRLGPSHRPQRPRTLTMSSRRRLPRTAACPTTASTMRSPPSIAKEAIIRHRLPRPQTGRRLSTCACGIFVGKRRRRTENQYRAHTAGRPADIVATTGSIIFSSAQTPASQATTSPSTDSPSSPAARSNASNTPVSRTANVPNDWNDWESARRAPGPVNAAPASVVPAATPNATFPADMPPVQGTSATT